MTAVVDSTHRHAPRVPNSRSVIAPPPAQRAAIWQSAIPVSSNHRELDRRPLLWLLGAHGGAGVTTLARLLAPAADCHRRWPGPATGQSPYVVLVARETTTGLASADALLRQHHAGLAGDCAVIGLVTVAARPGRVPASIRRDRKLYGELVSHLWRIDWHEAWTTTTHDALPVWNCTDAPPAHTSRDDLTTVPADVAALGRELITVIGTAEDPGPSMIGDKQ